MIDGFFGQYRFLSNFFPAKIDFEGEVYDSVEHSYQAAKTLDLDMRKLFTSAQKLTAGNAKHLGKNLKMRPDWEQVKLSVMEELLRLKFSEPYLKQLLLDTGDQELVESNTWNDVWWGVCNGKGENHLGKLLMKIREELKEQIK